MPAARGGRHHGDAAQLHLAPWVRSGWRCWAASCWRSLGFFAWMIAHARQPPQALLYGDLDVAEAGKIVGASRGLGRPLPARQRRHRRLRAGRSGRPHAGGAGRAGTAVRRLDRLRDLRRRQRARHHQLPAERQPGARARRRAGAHHPRHRHGQGGARPSGAAAARAVQPREAAGQRFGAAADARPQPVDAGAGGGHPAPHRLGGSRLWRPATSRSSTATAPCSARRSTATTSSLPPRPRPISDGASSRTTLPATSSSWSSGPSAPARCAPKCRSTWTSTASTPARRSSIPTARWSARPRRSSRAPRTRQRRSAAGQRRDQPAGRQHRVGLHRRQDQRREAQRGDGQLRDLEEGRQPRPRGRHRQAPVGRGAGRRQLRHRRRRHPNLPAAPHGRTGAVDQPGPQRRRLQRRARRQGGGRQHAVRRARDGSRSRTPACCSASTRTTVLRIGEYVALLILAILVLLLVIRPIVARAIEAMPVAAAGASPASAGRTRGHPGARRPGRRRRQRRQRALTDGRPEEMIDISRVEGRVKASSVKRVGEIVEKHPEETLAILRSWLHADKVRSTARWLAARTIPRT